MRACKVIGFSLIELMVVIAIVALLAAVATPAYKDYRLRAQIATNFNIVESIVQRLKDDYARDGSFPLSIDVNGVTVTNNIWTRIDSSQDLGDIYSVHYGRQFPLRGAGIAVQLKNLSGIPGYSEPSSAAPNNNASNFAVGLYVNDATGIITTECGITNSTVPANAIPLEYLPANCDCGHVLGSGSTGFIANGEADC